MLLTGIVFCYFLSRRNVSICQNYWLYSIGFTFLCCNKIL